MPNHSLYLILLCHVDTKLPRFSLAITGDSYGIVLSLIETFAWIVHFTYASILFVVIYDILMFMYQEWQQGAMGQR